jgi:TonB family protein
VIVESDFPMTSVHFIHRLKTQLKGGLNMFKMGMKNVAAVIFVLIATAISSAAQDPNRPDSQTIAPDAKAILGQVGEAYRNLRRYHFEGRYTQEQIIESMGLRDESKREELFVSAAIMPGYSRIESKNTHFSVTSVSDGKTKWVYASGANEYTRTEEGVRLGTGRLPTEAESHLARARNIVAGFSRIDYRLREAKFIGEEKLETGGWQVICLVIEAEYMPASATNQSSAWTRKFWIDKSRNIVLREIQHTRTKGPWGRTINTKMTCNFTFTNLDNQVTEALFAFVPPEGAKEVAELRSSSRPAAPPISSPRPAAPSPSRFVGKDAVAFALKDLNGNPVDLQSLKGKVALLNFWASWCGPCLAEMPHIEKLHKDFKDKGLVVLGINYDEEIEVASAFVKNKGYTFTILPDEGKEVSMKYGVYSIPQVFIIDRDGKIKWHARGYGQGSEVELRRAVEKTLKGVDLPAVSIRAGASVSPEEKAPKVADSPAPDAGGEWISITPEPSIVRFSTGMLSGQATKRVMPLYPPEAKKARAQGTVQVEITVSESGKVIEAKAISGDASLRDAAVEAAKQWEFKPAEVSGAPVKIQSILVFTFNLQ